MVRPDFIWQLFSGVLSLALALSPTQPRTDHPVSDSQREGKTSGENQEDVKAAATILDAEKKAIDNIRAGRPAPYYFAPPELEDASQPTTSPNSSKSVDAVKSKRKDQ
jgi:hypothetical protein